MSQNIVALTLENFRPVMLEESAQKLVVVYFWAQWDEPSLAQMNVIQGFVSKYPDTMLLATVNCDEQQEIVGQFGVKGLPTTIIVKDGQPVDGFAGPQDEQQLEQTFANFLPKPEEELLAQAQEYIAQEDYSQAFGLLKQAHEINPEHALITIAYADASVETGNVELSKSLIEKIGLVDQQAEYHAVVGKIELAEKASESPELLELQKKHAQQPDDQDIQIELAIQLQQAHKADEALALMFDIVKKDINYKDAKKIMLDMINALADGDALKSQYRRKIYSLLY
ncbi:tetratricopeptide repeat protein [Glaciecola sp. 2405UD65-10]|uniref:tetratricopeptide repeat protein n=1 Tax=Glaciecola sp. 2405UD65-10 TaxID=3397244 RepID=UPI003B5C0B1E